MFLSLPRILALTLGLVLAAPALAADQVPPIIYSQRTLANGLSVYTSLDRTTPNVTVQVWYGVGSKDDPVGRSGFAHLFEHMMFKATKDLPAESMDRFTEDVGGIYYASSYDDFTNYYEVVPANHLERLLWVESQRLGFLVVDEANFKSERDVVKEELRQRVLASPYGRLFALYLPKASYTTHPYRRPGIGSIEELDAATIDDVRAFHRAYYRPDNAALIVAGNFDEAQLQGWIDKYFGPLPSPNEPLKRVAAVEPPRTSAGVYTGYGPNVPLPAVAITWLGPKAADPDAPALNVLDAILSAGKSARLYDALVYDQQISAEVFSDADLPAQPGMFVVGSIMATGHTLEQGEQALLAVVRDLRDRPPSAAELAEAKTELVIGKLRERETLDGRAFALGYALRTQGDAAQANQELGQIQAVTAADVQRVARKYLTEDRRMTIRYLPESDRPKGEIATVETPPQVASVTYTGPVSALAPVDQRQAPPPIAAAINPVLPVPVEQTLANGLRVIVVPSSDLPLVTADLTIRVGAWADPEGLAGLAGMTAAMLTEGTKTRSAPQIAQQTEALGATLTSGGGQESASVTLNVMPEKLPQAMKIMADIARNPAFAGEELERQRAQTLDGLSVAYQDPGQLANYAASQVLFAGTAFGHVADGTPASVARLAAGDLAKLHQTYYRPDNAVLVLTGNISANAGFELAQKSFGDWARPVGPKPGAPDVTPTAKARTLAIDLPDTGQAAVTVIKPTIARTDPAYYRGLVANTVLGGGYSARLNQEIRIKRGLSYGASSALTPRRTTGIFRAAAQTKNESATQVLDLILGQMGGLTTQPAGAEELKARKSVLIGSFGRSLATTDGLAGFLSQLALYDVPLAEMNAYASRVEAVTSDEVQAFARAWLDPGDASVVIVGDAKGFEAGLKAARPGFEVIPAAALDLDDPTLRQSPRAP